MTEADFPARLRTPLSRSDAGGLANDTATFASRIIITGTLVEAMHFAIPTNPPSFPRRRESRTSDLSPLSLDPRVWIPTPAGMTAVGER
jgi:hypothetical protein